MLCTDPTLAPAESGVLVSGMGLDEESSATTLRSCDGERLLTDRPFAETKELLFSFFILDVADLDAAIVWAEKMPNRTYGSVEIRPLSVHEQ